jgi:hypothetical protein
MQRIMRGFIPPKLGRHLPQGNAKGPGAGAPAVTSLNPPLERLLGVMLGSVMIGAVILAWPSRSHANADLK